VTLFGVNLLGHPTNLFPHNKIHWFTHMVFALLVNNASEWWCSLKMKDIFKLFFLNSDDAMLLLFGSLCSKQLLSILEQ